MKNKKLPIGNRGLTLRQFPDLTPSEQIEWLKESVIITHDEDSITVIIFVSDGKRFHHYIIKDWDTQPTNGTKRTKNIARLLNIGPGQMQKILGMALDNGINVFRGKRYAWLSTDQVMCEVIPGEVRINTLEPGSLGYDYRWTDPSLNLVKEFSREEKDICDRMLGFIDSMTKGCFDKGMATLVHKMGNLCTLPAHSIDLYGIHGCGKSTLAYLLRDSISGPREYVADIVDLSEKFAGFDNNPLMVVCDEASGLLDTKSNARWKLLRSNPTRKVNQKYKAIRDGINLSGYIVTVNPGQERVIERTDRRDMIIDCYESPETRQFFQWVTKQGLWSNRGHLGAKLLDIFRRYLQIQWFDTKDQPLWSDNWPGQYRWTDISTRRASGRYMHRNKRGTRGILADDEMTHRDQLQQVINNVTADVLGYYPIVSSQLQVRSYALQETIKDVLGEGPSHKSIAPALNVVMATRGIERKKRNGMTVYDCPLDLNPLDTIKGIMEDMIEVINEYSPEDNDEA